MRIHYTTLFLMNVDTIENWKYLRFMLFTFLFVSNFWLFVSCMQIWMHWMIMYFLHYFLIYSMIWWHYMKEIAYIMRFYNRHFLVFCFLFGSGGVTVVILSFVWSLDAYLISGFCTYIFGIEVDISYVFSTFLVV